MHNCPLLAPKQTSARIDFLRQGERLVDKKATFCVKFLTKNYTKRLRRAWATARSPHRLTTANANGCRACSSRPMETVLWKCRSNLDFGSVLFSVKAFLGLSVTPYSFTPYYLLFSVKAFFGLPVTPYSFTPYYLLFSVKVFL